MSETTQAPEARAIGAVTQKQIPGLVSASLTRVRVEMVAFFRDWQSMLFNMALPVMMMLVFGAVFNQKVPGTDVDYRLLFISGMIAVGVMSTTFQTLAISITLDREEGLIRRLAASPMPRGAYFIGITVKALITTILEVIILMVLCGPILDALASGDRTAQAVGVEPARARILLLIPVSAAIALAVATAGGIGFVGLVVPHLVRSLIGPAHRLLVLGSALAAGLFLVWADAFARIAFAPAEVPIGVVTGLIGAPWLVLLVRRQGHSL